MDLTLVRQIFALAVAQGAPVEKALEVALSGADYFARALQQAPPLAAAAPPAPAPAPHAPPPEPLPPTHGGGGWGSLHVGRHDRSQMVSALAPPAGVSITGPGMPAPSQGARVEISMPAGAAAQGYTGQLQPGQARVDIAPAAGQPPIQTLFVEPSGVVRDATGQPVQGAPLTSAAAPNRASAQLEAMRKFAELQQTITREDWDAMGTVLRGGVAPARLLVRLAALGLFDDAQEALVLSQLGLEVYHAAKPRFAAAAPAVEGAP